MVDITAIKRIETALRASQERFATAFYASPQAMLIVKAPNGQAVSANPSLLKLIGYSESEMLGRTGEELSLWTQTDFQQQIAQGLATAGQIRASKTDLRRQDGTYRIVEVSVDPIQLDEAPHLLFNFHDITDREQAEAARRASEERFTKAFTASPQAMAISRAPGGEIVTVNSSMMELVGMAEDEMIGRNGDQLGIWVEAGVTQEIERLMTTEKKMRDYPLSVRHTSGEIRFVQVTAELVHLNEAAHILFLLNDVTDRRRAEDALRASEERFSKAFAASPQAMVIAQTQGSQIVSTNQSFCLMLGYEAGEILGSTIEALNLWVKPHHRETFRQLLKHNGHLRDWTTELRRQDGAERVVQISAEPVELNGTAHLLYLLVDITERKLADEALRASEERFSTAIQANPQPMAIFRESDQKIVFVNQAFLRQLGRPENEVIGHAASEFAWWQDAALQTNFLKLLAAQRKVHDFEAKWQVSHDDVRTHLLSAEYIRLDQEPHVLVVALDITERHRAEAELRASEERFSKAFQASPQPMVLATWPGGELVSINRSLSEATGYVGEDVLGKRLIELNAWLTPGDRTRFLQTAAPGQFRDWEVRLRVKSGQIATMQLSGETVELAGKPHLLVTATDVTARKQAEALIAGQVHTLELMASGAHLPAVLDTVARFVDEQQFGARTAIFLFDQDALAVREVYAPSLPIPLRQILVGKQINAESGVNGMAATSQQIAILADWQQHPSWENMCELMTAQHLRAAWALPIFDTQRHVLGTVCLYHDQPHQPSAAEIKLGEIAAQLAGIALEHHEAEQALRASEGRYRQLFERNLAGVYRVNELGQYLECNDAYAAIFGLSNAEELKRHKSEEFYFDLSDRELYLKLLRKQGSLTNYEMRLRKLDKTEVWVLSNVTLTEREGEPAILEGVLLDITKRKQAEAKLSEQREQLRALTAKISAIREEERTVISREIHDSLGQLLTGLKLDMAWLGKRINQQVEGETRKMLTKKTDSITELLDQTINTVRELATQLRPGILDTLGLSAAIEWQVEDLKKRSGIECELWLCPEPKNLPQEKATVIFRILQEILTNVIRHAEATRVVIHLMPNNDALLLTVIDNGRGITTAELHHPKSLGLLGMRERANSIGGEVKLEGAVGRGTTVTVRIPLGALDPAFLMNTSGMMTQR